MLRRNRKDVRFSRHKLERSSVLVRSIIRALQSATEEGTAVALSLCFFVATASAQTVLLGSQTINSNLDSSSVGVAEAFPATATVTAQVTSINFFLDDSSSATKIYLGVYSDSGGKPGSLLTQGSASQLFPGTWNTVSLPAANLTSGTAYWIAILGATGGKPYFYDQSTTACSSQTSSQSNLTSLPSTWSKGKSWSTCYLSAYAVSGNLPATVMLGNQVVESNLDKNSAGQAEAFPFVANTTGSLATIVFYLDPTSGSGPIHIGLYADNGHNHPGTLLGQGSTSSPVAGSWNQVSVSASNITAGTRYWIALFGTSATSPYFRDRQTTACHSETSSQTNLASLPTTWSTGTTWNTCYLAAYGQATSGSPVLSISPTSLNFTAIQGGTNPPAANFSVTNTGTGSLGFTVSTDQSWLSATPTGGTAPQTIQVAASVGSLSPGTYTGHVTVTATGAQNSPGQATVTFIVSQFVPPSISASVSPTPNGNGWNNSAVTVTFSCTAGSYSIQSCPAPVQVNTQGTNQVVTGSVFDTAGDTNTAKVTLNIDLASPVLSIASPANGGSFTSSPVSVSGTVSGSISGVATVTCNGANATVQNGSYSCAVPLSPGSDTIAVQAMNVAGSATTQSINESLIVPATITSFGPPSSSIGAIVTIQGSGFAQNAFSPEVTLNQAGGGTIVAPISGNTANSLSFVIPAGAASGPITVTVDGLTATSSSSLSVVSSSTFAIAASPSSATLLPGQTAIVQVSLTSTNGFTQLASLNVSGLPSGVTANFQPAQITAGGSAWLSLTAPAGQSASTSTLTISASATVQGIAQTQTATVGLNVQALTGSATFAGQVAVTGVYNTPLVGVTVSFTGTNYTGATTGCTGSTTTDAGGNFVLSGLSSSCTGSQMIQYDPSTVTSPPGKYSGVTLSYVLAAGQVTTPGIAVHLPNVANAEAFTISQNSSSNQVFTSKSIPGVTITVYAGTQFSLPDGTQPDPFPLSVLEIPYNQIPDYMPPNPTEDPVFAMSVEPFNSSSSQPIAISYPNRTNAAPGTDMPLTSLNPTMGMMQNYGTGAVSSDGTQIVPDTDPAHPGHLYGISHFDWHFALPFPRGQNNPCPGRVQCATGGDPIDLSSGLLVLRKTDIAFGGARGQVSIERIYRNGVVGTPANPNGIGPFGAGTAHNYWYFLDVTNAYQTPGVVGLVTPDGNDLPFTQQSDGTYLNTTAPSLSGAVLTLVSGTPLDGTYNLRWKTGALFQFQTFSTGGTFFVTVLASITDTNGNVTSIVHNPTSAMQITQIVDPVGRSLNFTYNGDFVTSMTDPIGRTVHYTYNSQAALATVTDVNGGTTQYGYDAKNNLTSITDARGIVYLQNTYDANGRVIKQITGDGGTTTFQYTQLNPSVSTSPVIATTVTDARGNPTTYQFNPQGYVISVTDALNEQTVYNVDPSSNLLTSFTDPLQRTTTLTYDSTQNITSVTRLSGTANAVTTSMTYDPIFSKVTSITDPLGHKTTMQYDPTTGNLLTLSNPMSNTVTLTYDNFGEIVSAQDPVGNSTSLKYSNGDLVSATDPLGRVQRRSTDAVSRPVTVTNALGQTTQMQFDALNHLVLLADPKGGRYSLNYDPNGNLSSIVDANQHTTSFSYDSMDRLIGRTDPLGHSESYQRDLNGNITQFADRRGIVTSALYDALNRIASITFGSQESIQYSYDSVNRLTQALDSLTGSISFGFDGLSRLTSEITPWGSVNYAYDAAGRRSGMTVSGQNPVSYTFDNASRLTQIVQGTSTAQFSYDSDGRRSNVTLPNGVSEQYSYDIASQLTQISYQLNATVLGNLTYGYDASGKRTSVGGSFARTGLPSALTSASYNADNQLTQFGAASLSYDANGNLVNDGTNTYTWNSRNQLSSIAGAVNASFQYDAFGRRVKATAGATSTNFVYDNLNPVQQLSAGVPTANFLVGRGLDEYLQSTTSSGTVDFLSDALGSVIALAGQNGSLLNTYTYDPFGNSTVTGNSPNAFQYTGRENDNDGWYFLRARYYSPAFQRFASEDPIGFGGGPNVYSYARNNPISYLDPNGRDPVIGATVGVILGGLTGAAAAAMQGGSNTEIIEAAAEGAIVGLVGGFADPAMGLGVLAVYGGVIGGVANIAGQETVIINSSDPCKQFSVGGLVGAVWTGAVSVASNAAIPLLQASLEVGEWAATALATGEGSALGSFSGPLIGQGVEWVQSQMPSTLTPPKCGCH